MCYASHRKWWDEVYNYWENIFCPPPSIFLMGCGGHNVSSLLSSHLLTACPLQFLPSDFSLVHIKSCKITLQSWMAMNCLSDCTLSHSLSSNTKLDKKCLSVGKFSHFIFPQFLVISLSSHVQSLVWCLALPIISVWSTNNSECLALPIIPVWSTNNSECLGL